MDIPADSRLPNLEMNSFVVAAVVAVPAAVAEVLVVVAVVAGVLAVVVVVVAVLAVGVPVVAAAAKCLDLVAVVVFAVGGDINRPGTANHFLDTIAEMPNGT